jgi:hemolysin D
MVIVPEGAPVTAEVMIENKDIGFVREGQAAAVKLETFNFTRYGTLPATVTRLSADAVQDEKRGALFTATVALVSDRIEIDGRSIRLTPGMNVTVEIKTGNRRVIEYLLSPIRKSLDESLKER